MKGELVFRLAILALLIAFVANRGYYTNKYGRSEDETVQDRKSSAVVWVASGLNSLALLATAVYLIMPRWLEWAALPLPASLRWAGAGIALVGFALLQWAHLALSRNWSDRPRLLQAQTLTTSGPYHWVRHPIYTAFLLILSAPLFLSANWLVGLLWIGATALEVVARVRYEESLLADTFGNEYQTYAARTGRLLPRLYHSMG